ncbi:MAG: heme lyase CcmF/NrfE family subunit [Proteobacteria bacterium]|nr:heme lyase CcmF/NrfE family subunit [Pseudomonadota bacterium]
MFVDIGYFAMLSAMALAIFSMIALVFGIQRNNLNLMNSAKNGLTAKFVMVAVAYLALTYAFAADDFSVRFVSMNSSTDLPLFYKLTAVWGGMEGSLLLWQLILSFFTLVVVWRYKSANREILPHTMVVLAGISIFLLFLLLGWSNPFARVFPIPDEGRGLNPLLQNPGMVYHPPSLYLGYVGFSVPFAFALGSLMKGKLDNNWILSTRRWTLFSWFFLTMGMLLGAQWAYIELGWGGYWAWDPVENASLMPWLTGTAFLHSVIVQEKRNGLKVWNMVLVISTFLLSILGTFITRSGVLGSVHAFAKSNIGPAFLLFIAVVFVISLGLLLFRQAELSSDAKTAGFFCKENSFLLNNIVFVVMCFTVLYGTIFPLLAEGVANKKLSIQAPFFNSIMLPLAVVMILLMGLTHFLGWRKTSTRLLVKNVLIPLLCSIAMMGTITFLTGGGISLFLLGSVTIFSGIIILIEFVQSIRVNQKQRPQAKKEKVSIAKTLFGDQRRKGGLIVHLGIVFFAIGVCGNYFNLETSFTFGPGEKKLVDDYNLEFRDFKRYQERNATHQGIVVDVKKNGEKVTELIPVKSFYPTSPQPMTEVAIYRTILEDLYISLSSINEDGSATVVVYVNPMVSFIWASMVLFSIGILYSLSYKPAQFKKLKS